MIKKSYEDTITYLKAHQERMKAHEENMTDHEERIKVREEWMKDHEEWMNAHEENMEAHKITIFELKQMNQKITEYLGILIKSMSTFFERWPKI